MESKNDNNIDNKISKNYEDLDKLRKIIEELDYSHHLEIAKIFKNNDIKLTENNNGVFINLNNISDNIIEEIKHYLNFVNNQEKLIHIDESKKESLENKYFQSK